MTSLYYFSSTDTSKYGTVYGKITPLVAQPVQVRVSSIQYQANFSITTEDDYIKLDEEYFYFPQCGFYLVDTLPSILTNAFKNDVNITLLNTGLLRFHSENYKQITDASHRVKMLLGLYHTEFPINIEEPWVAPSVPLTNYGNMLFLLSNIPSIVGLGDGTKEEYKSIVYKSSDFIYPGIAVNSRTPGPVVVSKSDALTDLKFELVDFMMEPVILHSPLYITFEVFYSLLPTPMLPTS
jgi:hypothetical protein